MDRAAEVLVRIRDRPRGLLHDQPDASATQLDTAITRGALFLHRRQHRDGSLRGFQLHPGASTSWLTAHVAFVLEEAPQLEPLCRAAAESLASTGAEDGGWGYNRRVAVDCDSWAQALLVLQRFSVPFEGFLLENLAATQLPCGGFPTYPVSTARGAPASGWHSAHPDVSALVLEALRRAGGFDASVSRCLSWLNGCLRGGVLPSYWWPGDGYSLWVQARAHLLPPIAASRTAAALHQEMSSPQVAMCLTAATGLRLHTGILRQAAIRLLAQQFSDGSWPCAPCLRVTTPGFIGARRAPLGPVVADHRRVFSTAHSIAALTRLRNLLQS